MIPSKFLPDARTIISLFGMVLLTLQADFPTSKWVTGLIAAAAVLGVHVTGLSSASSPASTTPAPPAP